MSSELSNLLQLLQIPSIKGEPTPNAPFGQECRRALDFMLELGRAAGFEVFDDGGYAGHIEFGQGDFVVGALAHLDVVPAGDGWTRPPFDPYVEGGKIIGRGATDDKGPALACFYAMKKLRDEGAVKDARIRLILGCDEENGSSCIAHYKTVMPPPNISFSPDSDFPIINIEKGIIRVQITVPADDFSKRYVRRFKGGKAVNAVPDFAEAELSDCDGLDMSVLQAIDGVFIEKNAASVIIKTRGKSAHSMAAEKGVNAVVILLSAFDALQWGKTARTGAFWCLDRLGKVLHGETLDIAFSDAVSGGMTVNFARAELTERGYLCDLDIRAPISVTPDQILQNIRALLPRGGSAELITYAPHLFAPPDEPPVSTLLEVYERMTGKPGKCIVTGGGTYARSMPRCVAFGAMDEGCDNNIHGADEYLEVERFFSLIDIYAEAFKALAKTK